MMKKVFILCAMAFMATSVRGQGKRNSLTVTPQVGVSLGKQTGIAAYSRRTGGTNNEEVAPMNYTPSAQYKAGVTAGLEVSYQATNEWAFSLGVLYTQAGSKYKDFEVTYTDAPQQAAANGEATATTDWYGHALTNQRNTFGYIMVPIMAHYYATKGLAVKAGVEFGFLSTAKKQWDQTDFTVNQETKVTTFGKPNSYEVDMKDDAKKAILTLPIGLSYEYEHVVLDARYHVPLVKAMKSVDTYNRLFTLTVGYQF